MRSPAFNASIWKALVCGLFLWQHAVFGEDLGFKRRDLPPSLALDFCEQKFEISRLWRSQIFDAQVEGVFLEADDNQKLSDKFLQTEANALAKELGYRAVAWGQCSAATGWVAAFPSLTAIKFKGGKLEVPGRGGCANKLKGFWVGNGGGRSRELTPSGDVFAMPSKSGYFSIECPTTKSTSAVQFGQEFFLGPSGAKIERKTDWDQSVPYLEKKGVGKNPLANVVDIMNWIRRIRQAEKLPDFKNEKILDDAAAKLASRPKVSHEEAMLTSVAKDLQDAKFLFVGEDRVRGKTLEEALFLLWASPRHRDLLLQQNATHLGAHLSVDSTGLFLVLVAARPLH